MQLLLVRHGQSTWQVERGTDWDSSLTDVGIAQARHLAKWLATGPGLACEGDVPLRRLVTSPLRRSVQTVSPVAEELCLPVTCHVTLGEARFHVADDLPSRPHPTAAMNEFSASARYADFKRQAGAALAWLTGQAEDCGGLVMAVSHGGLIKTLLRVAAGSDGVCFRLYNTGINLIEWRLGRWHIVHINRWDHLPPGLRTQ